jgi:hypothetical protein
MAQKWEDQGAGKWKVTVDAEDGVTPVQVFYGTEGEIARKMAQSVEHGSRRITELKKGGTPPAPTVMRKPVSPRPMTDTERFQVAAEMNNPNTVERAVTRVLESVVGPVDAIRESAVRSREEEETQTAVEAAAQFADETPNWYPSDHNKRTLTRFMITQNLSPTRVDSYRNAFGQLSNAGLLQPMPENPDQPEAEPRSTARTAPVPAAPRPAPARVSTGIRQSDISGGAVTPRSRPKYTPQFIMTRTKEEHKRLMLTDPEYVRANESVVLGSGARKPQQRRAG